VAAVDQLVAAVEYFPTGQFLGGVPRFVERWVTPVNEAGGTIYQRALPFQTVLLSAGAYTA
jgi:hypothetical protein